MNTDFKCLVPDCTANNHQARGLCLRHYAAIAQLVHRKHTTWLKLEKHGKVAPVGSRTTRNKIKAWALDEKGKRA